MIKRTLVNTFRKGLRFLPGSQLPSYKLGQQANWSEWSTEKAIAEGYKASTWVYSCINLIGRSTASVPWYVYKRNSSGDWERQDNHPLEQLIEKPNPYQSRKDFIEIMTSHLYLGGNSIFSKVKANDVTVELWSITPDAIKVIPSKTDFIDHYLFEKDGIKHKFKPSEIIHNMFIDPSNPWWGLSPLQAGAKVVDTDLEAVAWNKLSLQNRAITDGIFSLGQNLTADQYKELRKQVREQHQGADNARTPWILGSGASYQQMSLSPIEMDFIASRQFTRTEIASLFQVPPPMIGILDNANYSNIETARKIFWQDTIIPFLEDIKSNLNLALTPDFGDDIKLDYDVSNVEAIQENLNEKINNARNLWAMGVPFNEINQRLELGFDEIPGGDVGFLPSSVIPTTLSASMFSDNGNAQTNAGEDDDPPSGKSMKHKSETDPIEELKTIYWKNSERRRTSYYNSLSRKASSLFDMESDRIIGTLEKDGIEAMLEDIESGGKAWTDFLNQSWTDIVADFGADTWEQLQPRKSKNDNAFDPWDRIIQEYIHRNSAEKVTNVLQFTKDSIAQLVHDNRENRGTIKDLASAIKSRYQDFSRYRAFTIARTETVGASNYGSYASAKQTGLKLRREWISSRDDRVRDSHDHIDGEKVGLDEQFSNGLMYPADYEAGIPEETINCRCAVRYLQD